MADAGEVGNRIERGGIFDPDDEVVCQFPGGAARAVGHADEGGFERFQFGDRTVESLRGFGRLRGEEFERKRRLLPGKNILNVHVRAIVARISGRGRRIF